MKYTTENKLPCRHRIIDLALFLYPAKSVLLSWAILLLVAELFIGCAGGIPSIPNTPEAIFEKGKHYFERGKYYQSKELFKAFLARYPGHDSSDEAQFYMAESYYLEKEHPLAAIEYRLLVSNYGYSEYVDDAFFKVALCSYKEAPGPNLDQSKSFEALSLFEQFLRTFPNSPLVEEAHKIMGDIRMKLAEKDFKNGKYYYRRKRFKSAIIYFDKVIKNYPGNEFWLRALYYKGSILLTRGDREDAVKLFERVLEYPGKIGIKKEAENALKMLKGS